MTLLTERYKPVFLIGNKYSVLEEASGVVVDEGPHTYEVAIKIAARLNEDKSARVREHVEEGGTL